LHYFGGLVMCGNNKVSASQIRVGIVMNSLLARTNLSEAERPWSNIKWWLLSMVLLVSLVANTRDHALAWR
jgi:hypothetical protein